MSSRDLNELKEILARDEGILKTFEAEKKELEHEQSLLRTRRGGPMFGPAEEQRLEAIGIRLSEIETKTTPVRREAIRARKLVKDTIEARKDKDQLRDEILAMDRKIEAFRDLVATANDPAIMEDPVEHKKVIDELRASFNDIMGKRALLPRSGKEVDLDAAMARIDEIVEAQQIKLDAVYGNVDEGKLRRDRPMLEKAEKQVKEVDARREKFDEVDAKYDELLASGVSVDDIKAYEEVLADYKEAVAKVESIKRELDALDAKIKAIDAKISKLKVEIEALNKKNPRAKEEDKKLAALNKEMDGLKKTRAGLIKDKENKKKELKDATIEVDAVTTSLQNFGEMGTYNELKTLVAALGIKDFKIEDDLEDGKASIEAARTADDEKRAEAVKVAREVLKKYGMRFSTKDTDYTKRLNDHVENVRSKPKLLGVQPEYAKRIKDERAEEQAENLGGGPSGTVNPVSRGGVGFGSYGGGGVSNPGGPAGNPTPGTGAPTPGAANPEQKKYARDLKRGSKMLIEGHDVEVVDLFDSSVELADLVKQSGRTKIEGDKVYRMVNMGPDPDDPKVDSYAYIKEDINQYCVNTSAKLTKEVDRMIDSMKRMSKEDRDALIDTFSGDQKTQIEKIVKGKMPWTRGLNRRALLKSIKSQDKQTQLELLVAYRSTAGVPELMAQATQNLKGNIYPGAGRNVFSYLKKDGKGIEIPEALKSKDTQVRQRESLYRGGVDDGRGPRKTDRTRDRRKPHTRENQDHENDGEERD